MLREGSLSGAARTLGLTQPTIARHIEQLEAALGGVPLFTRSPHGLAPTQAAAALTPHAEAMEAAAAALARTASGAADEAAGVVRITASVVVGVEVLPPMLRDLRIAYPHIDFEVAPSNETADLLRRDADIAIRMTKPKQEALVARKIGDIMLGMYAHRSYIEAQGAPRTVEDLRSHAIIGYDRETTSLQALKATGLPLGRDLFAYRTDSDLAQLAAIRAGFGIGLCQDGIARRDPDLVRLLPDVFAFALPTWVTMHGDLRGIRRMRVVFDHLVETMMAYAQGAR